MSFAHYTDNPTECPLTLDSNLVAVENWTYPTAHSRSMGPFGCLSEQASLTKVSLSGEQTSSMFFTVSQDMMD